MGANTGGYLRQSKTASPTSQQIEDQYDERNHQKQVNQPASNMQAETQCPQNQYDDKDCPKHLESPQYRKHLKVAKRLQVLLSIR